MRTIWNARFKTATIAKIVESVRERTNCNEHWKKDIMKGMWNETETCIVRFNYPQRLLGVVANRRCMLSNYATTPVGELWRIDIFFKNRYSENIQILWTNSRMRKTWIIQCWLEKNEWDIGIVSTFISVRYMELK